MKASSKLSNLRISPQKVRSATDHIKGLDISDAQIQLENTIKRPGLYLNKVLSSAIANAENNLGLDRDNLYVYDIQVGEGTKLKRWMPRAYGRATQIIKRSSNVILTLEERVEGKNRKTKEQLEKEKKEREESKKQMEKEIKKEKEDDDKEEKNPEVKLKKEPREEIETRKGARKGSWAKKMFRRKSD